MAVIAARPWAVTISVAAHAGALAAMLLWTEPEKSGAQAEGMGGIAVSLGPSGSPAGTAVVDAAETISTADAAATEVVDAVEPTEVVDAVEPAEEVVEAEQTPDAVAAESAPAETVPAAEPVPTPAATPDAVAAVAPVSDVAEVPISPAAEPVVTARTVDEVVDARDVETQVATRVAAPPPPRKPEPPPAARPAAQRPVAQAPRREEEELLAAVPPQAGAGGEAGASTGQDAGSADTATAGGGSPGALQDYAALVRAWIERYKAYPDRAQMRRQEGTVLLAFTLDRQGNVMAHRIVESSGYDLLDQAAADMVERASPFPPLPDDLPGPSLDLQLPVPFDLR